jgi:hypothetical protein
MRVLLDEPVDKVNKWRNERLCIAFRKHWSHLTEDTLSATLFCAVHYAHSAKQGALRSAQREGGPYAPGHLDIEVVVRGSKSITVPY